MDITNVNFCNQVSTNEVACCYIVSQSDTEVREVVFQLDLDVPSTTGVITHKVSAIRYFVYSKHSRGEQQNIMQMGTKYFAVLALERNQLDSSIFIYKRQQSGGTKHVYCGFRLRNFIGNSPGGNTPPTPLTEEWIMYLKKIQNVAFYLVTTKIDESKTEEVLHFFDYNSKNFASFRLDELQLVMKTTKPEELKGTLLSLDSY